ncbi:MAG: (Fe-S)-binding protein [Deltaproteobacteria bacterium]|nr:(Fe-S)-binding protein [Deltaproteobacteria bacterium]
MKYNPSKTLSDALRQVQTECVECGLCQIECRFLQEYGSPKQIADGFDLLKEAHRTMAYACSLCHLCTAVCPKGLNPAAMFLEMRRAAVKYGLGPYPQHKRILDYELRGVSRRYTWYGLPAGCETVFFPGCTFTGTRPETTLAFYRYLKQYIPSAGIILDCCAKPSHDLGRQQRFQALFNEMKGFLIENGVKKVIVACPNCHQIFKQYAGEIAVATAYEFMANDGIPTRREHPEAVTVHDPCALRFEAPVQLAVRQLLKKQGLTVQEMRHHGRNTLCCGEGGSAGCLAPELSEQWGILRKKEGNGRRTFTYCAGCVSNMRRRMPTGHLLDLMFEPEKALKGRNRVLGAPLTYLARLWVKKRLKREVHATVIRERNLSR